MNINQSPRSLLCLRNLARKLWREPDMQRKWLRAYLRARGWGGLVIEGAPGWHARRNMSRPREYRAAAEVKRDPRAFEALQPIDDEAIRACEHITGWSWPEPDASRTFPGFDKKEKKK